MRYKLVLSLILIIIMSTNVLGAITVSLSPQTAYETNSISFELNVSNNRGPYEITDLRVILEGFESEAIVDYHGWTESHLTSDTGDEIVSRFSYNDGSIASNVHLAIFEFLATALPVESEQTINAQVILTDSDDEEHTFTYPITIMNDDTPPQITEVEPQDEGYISEGENDFTISAKIADEETGIQNATFHWVRCDEENATVIDFERQLAETDGTYSAEVDFSSYTNEQEICFEFKAYNKGGDYSEYTGTLTVDGVPPDVTLVAPLYNGVIGSANNFSFFADDNMATTMTCDLFVDDDRLIENIDIEIMDVVFVSSQEMTEGEHTWKVECRDPAENVGQSETWVYTLDKTPPNLVMTEENNTVVSGDTIIGFEATDNYNMGRVYFRDDNGETRVETEFEINVSNWPEGPNEFAVLAEDSVGNRAEQTYTIIVDRTSPTIELISPEHETTSDVHVDFTYNVIDEYNSEVDCTVYINDAAEESQQVSTSETSVYTKILDIGNYRWNVQCVDGAGNIGESSERQVSVIDTSGPDVEFNLPTKVFRGDLVELSLDVTDVSGVDSVTAVLRDIHDSIQSIPLERVGDTYVGEIQTAVEDETGTYVLEVYAIDTLNNSNNIDSSYELLHTYAIDMTLNPDTTNPGNNVIASGVVVIDDGSSITDLENIEIEYPISETENNELNLELIDDEFTYTFNAPANVGVYEVTIRVESENGEEFTRTEELIVRSPTGDGSTGSETSSSGSNGGSGGSSGGSSSIRSEEETVSCSMDWSCTAWTQCTGSEQRRVCVDMNRCAEDARRTETRDCSMPTEGVDDEGVGVSLTPVQTTIPEEPVEETIEVEATGDAPEPTGVGKATSFFNLGTLNLGYLIMVILATGLLLGAMYKFGWGKRKKSAVELLGTRQKVSLDDYLEKRAARRRKW